MRVPIVVPYLGHREEQLRISGWYVYEGDLIVAGDLVVEVLIPGITMDIAAESSGRLVEVVKAFDSIIHEGDILGWLEDSSADAGELSTGGD